MTGDVHGVHRLFSSGDADELKALRELLNAYPRVRVSYVRQGPLLVGWEELPFIVPAQGGHITGIECVAAFLDDAQCLLDGN